MNVILIMVDSLNRTYLEPYGNDWIKTPNFNRLAERCVTCDRHWTGSLPTMPCRHEVMAGRHEYLWRGWGPLEPYDVTLAQLCREKDQVSMLLTDCYHYFQEGSGGNPGIWDRKARINGDAGAEWSYYEQRIYSP